MVNYLINIYKKYGDYFQGRFFWAFILFYKYHRITTGLWNEIAFIIRAVFKSRVYSDKNKAKRVQHLLRNTSISINNSRFFYSIDIFKTIKASGRVYGNCTVDYSKIIYGSLQDLQIDGDDEFANDNNKVIDAILEYLGRVITTIDNADNCTHKDTIIRNLTSFNNQRACTLDEALQRILFINSIQWQTGHILVGLGRIDKYLDEFVDDSRTDDELIEIFKEFFRCLHTYYEFKSNALMGDTGQIIILGGSEQDGTYFWNRFSKLILESSKEVQLPDPKILVRVSRETPVSIYEDIMTLMENGAGSPLISNDDEVIPKLVDFGYKKKDAYNYITSACWEPVVGESYEQNNILSVNYLEPFSRIPKEYRLDSFSSLMSIYLEKLREYIAEIIEYLDSLKWDQDPLYSSFNENARKNHSDISNGGSEYNNYGILTVAMSNAVNSLLIIKDVVFDRKILSYWELDEIRRNNNEKLKAIICDTNHLDQFGNDNVEVIGLVNEIAVNVEKWISEYRNRMGGKIKFGLSSPHYIMDSVSFPASFDGRQKGDPFNVHISSDTGIAYTELFNFASQLDYSGAKFNGNVVDLMVNTGFLRKNRDQFIKLIQIGLLSGVYQLQINLVDSKILLLAKQNPENYKGLIVRVWGFNAYFVELPEEYQNMLIERAQKNEKNIA